MSRIRRRGSLVLPAKPQPPQPPQRPPTPRMSQDAARERWRKGLSVEFTDDFRLSTEIRGLCGPLSAQMAQMFAGRLGSMKVVAPVSVETPEQGRALPFRQEVVALAGAVQGLLLAVVAIMGDRELGSAAAGRSAAAAVVSDPAYSVPPAIGDEAIRSGAWVDVLAAHVAVLDEPLAAQLGRAPGNVSAALVGVLGREFLPKMRHLELKIPGMRRSLQQFEELSRAAAEVEQRRSQDRLQRLGLV